MVYIIDKTGNMSQGFPLYPPWASPSAVRLFILTDMHDGSSLISPLETPPFIHPICNNENINCNALNH